MRGGALRLLIAGLNYKGVGSVSVPFLKSCRMNDLRRTGNGE